MPTYTEIFQMIRPDGGWVVYEGDLNATVYDEGVEPVTEEEFGQAMLDYPAWKTAKDEELVNRRQAILDRLGLTEDEAKLILS